MGDGSAASGENVHKLRALQVPFIAQSQHVGDERWVNPSK